MIQPQNLTQYLRRLALIVLLTSPGITLANCPEGQRYYNLAMQAGGSQQFDKAAEWLQRSLQECETYDAWHLLGMAQQKQRALEASLEAYGKAVDLAPNSDSAAISVARYGQVLALNGQRYEALTMLERAMELHSNPPSWIRTTAREIDLNIVNQPLTRDSIKRSLSSQEFGLLANNKLTQLQAGGSDKTAKDYNARIRIPINFEYDSVTLDELTRTNLQQLGAVLSEKAYAGKTFTLIGHTDVRGGKDYNFQLSRGRAKAIKQALTQQYPSLDGRLIIDGAGETQPKYQGEKLSEVEHRLNRRLEVFIN